MNTKTRLAPERRRGSGDERQRSEKGPQTNLRLPLTKHNLQKHNTLMESEADSAGGRRLRKRPASLADLAEECRLCFEEIQRQIQARLGK